MKGQTYTVAASAGGNSHSGIFVPDTHLHPFSIGFGGVITTTAKWTIQHTFQDPLQTTAAGLTWFPHEFVVAASANDDGNYSHPVAGIRVEISAADTGSVSVTFIQAGIVS
jgi:hypothetical protein